MAEPPLLEVRNLQKYFTQNTKIFDWLVGRERQNIQAVDDVSFTLEQNGRRGIIGESGCGKSTLLMTLMGLYEPTGGDIYFEGQPMSEFDKGDWRRYRQNVSMIFQDPFNSLDPKYTVKETVIEPLEIHGFDNQEQRVLDVLKGVSLNPPEDYLNRQPSNLSGGEKQRVSIARALVTEPKLLLADEPVSMLDVSTQASVLNLLAEKIKQTDIAMLYISHDLSTVSYTSNELDVMYLGRVVESGPTSTLIESPKHPYTSALIEAIPIPDPSTDRQRTELSGSPRDPINLEEGCRFRDRCPERMEICQITPVDYAIDEEHTVACHLHYDHEAMGGTDVTASTEQSSSTSTEGIE